MCSGSSGSGKTYFLQYAITQLQDCNIILMDFKQEFRQFDSCRNYVGGDDIPDALENYYNYFQRVRKHEEEQEKQCILIIDEIAALLMYLDKKRADRIRNILQSLLCLGRSVNKGFGTWLCCQTMHASIFVNSSVRENAMIQVRIGDFTTVAWDMQFAGVEKPSRRFDRGQGCILCDGKPLQLLLVPKINNPERMYEIISDRLNGIWN